MSHPLPLNRRQLLQLGGALLAWPLLPRRAAAYTAGAVAGGAHISGRVRYAGKAPRPGKVKLSGDCAYCRRFDLREETLLVHRTGGLRNVVVALDSVKRGKAPAPGKPTLAEHRCTFEPHVLSVTAGTKILLHNQDPVLNTFHAIELPSGRTLFNVGTPLKDQKLYRRIRRPGLIQMRCDVHPWERGYIYALPHPYHCVTDPRGHFDLTEVPAGRYTLTLWHEQLGAHRQQVVLAPGAHLQLQLSYPAG